MADSRVTGAIGGGLQGASSGSAFGPAGTVVGGVLGAVAGGLAGGGENRARNLARQQADLYRLESEENLRRLRIQQRQAVGTARAAVGASNLQYLYSPVAYTNQLESTYLADAAFENLASSLRQRMAMNQGQAAADTIRYGGYQSLLQGAGAALQTWGPTLLDKFKPATQGGWMATGRTPL